MFGFRRGDVGHGGLGIGMWVRRIAGCLLLMPLLSACAYRGPSSEALTAGSDGVYVGWVRFVGEFVLYDDREAFLERRRDHCVSGALPFNEHRVAARTFDGKRVRVTGVAVEWSLPDPMALSLNHKGSPIANWCAGSTVIFGTEMKLE